MELNAAADKEFHPRGTCTHPPRIAKRLPIATGLLVVGTHDVSVSVGRESDFAKVVTVPRQTGKAFVAIGGLFPRFFADLNLHIYL